MFLTALQKQNPALIDATISLWQQGKILPDTYVIDVDQLIENACLLLEQANKYGIKLYAMTKQIGRNPWICQRLLDLGYEGIVAVDYKEVRQLYQHNIPVAHIGHLVQPPVAMLEQIIQQKPEVITVYSLEKALQISAVAQQYNYTQSLLLKVYQTGDKLYPGQEAGFELSQLSYIIAEIAELPNVKIVGATHFPCMLYDEQQHKTLPTENFATLIQAKQILLENQIAVEQINAPSASSCETLPFIAQLGATHAEPGHALTGTSPANIDGQQPERIALLYLTEISHHYQGNSYCFGGGYYRRGHLKQAYVINSEQPHLVDVLPLENSSIDYCFTLKGHFAVSSPVIMCFRTQIFVTRSDIALVTGIQHNQPELIGLYDSLGNVIHREAK